MSFSRDDRGSGVLGGVPLAELFDAPARFGADPELTTPAYVYDLDGMVAEARALDVGFGAAPHLIAFAVKDFQLCNTSDRSIPGMGATKTCTWFPAIAKLPSR